MSAEQYRSESQQLLLGIVGLLASRPLTGLDLGDIVNSEECSRDQAYRALQNLSLAGWAEQTGGRGGAWRLTPVATQISERMRVAIADLHRTYLGDPS